MKLEVEVGELSLLLPKLGASYISLVPNCGHKQWGGGGAEDSFG